MKRRRAAERPLGLRAFALAAVATMAALVCWAAAVKATGTLQAAEPPRLQTTATELPHESDHCYNVAQQPDPCAFVRASCPAPSSAINYVEVVFCTLGGVPAVGLVLLLVWLAYMFAFLATAGSDFFCPNLAYISDALGLSETVSGVTLAALGNGASDLFSTFSALSASSSALAFGELLGAGLFVTTAVVGAVALVSPVTLPRRPFLRDVGFFLLAIVLLLWLARDGRLTLVDSAVLIGYYLAYVVTVIVGNFIYRRQRRRRLRLAEAPAARSEMTLPLNPDAIVPEVIPEPPGAHVRHVRYEPFMVNYCNYGGAAYEAGGVSGVSDVSEENIGVNGRRVRIPAMVETLTQTDRETLIRAWSLRERAASPERPLSPETLPIELVPEELVKEGIEALCRPQMPPLGAIGLLLLPLLPLNASRREAWAKKAWYSRAWCVLLTPIWLLLKLTVVLMPGATEESGHDVKSPPKTLDVQGQPQTPTDRFWRLLELGRHIRAVFMSEVALICIEVVCAPLLVLALVFDWDAMVALGPVRVPAAVLVCCATVPSAGALWWFLAVSRWPRHVASRAREVTRESGAVDRLSELVRLDEATLTMRLLRQWRLALPLAVFGFVAGIMWVQAISNEVVGIFQALVAVSGIDEQVLGVTIFAIGNSVPDLVTNVAMARLGFPALAVGSCFGGPMLNMILGPGLAVAYLTLRSAGSLAEAQVPIVLCGTLVYAAGALILTLWMTLVVVPVFHFRLSRAHGVVLIVGYFGAISAIVALNYS